MPEGKYVPVDIQTPFGNVPFPGPDINIGPKGLPGVKIPGLPSLPSLPSIPGPEKVIGGAGGLLSGSGIPGLSQVGEGLSGIADIAKFFKGFGELVLTPEGWLRLAKLMGGAIFVLWGLRVVIRESSGTDPVKVATNTAKKGVEAAALVATVK